MQVFSYIVSRDFGFAPNPFGHFCTLSTCKPIIRKNARINDWIIGTGAKGRYQIPGRLIFAMKVSERMTFDEYWGDSRFQYKKPIFHGSLKQCFGDNIYQQSEHGVWQQSHSHHSNPDGSENTHNLRRDTRFPFTLISETFYYFGKQHVEIPEDLVPRVCATRQGQIRVNVSYSEQLIDWIQSSFEVGIVGDPIEFENGFSHYDGVS